MEYEKSVRGMSFVPHCSENPSKSVQSEDLTSDSSCDESNLDSSKDSSRQDIKRSREMSKDELSSKCPDGKVSGTFVVHEKTRKISTESLQFQSQLDHNDVRTKWSRHFQWGVLLSFGITLWTVLCLVDILQSDTFARSDCFIAKMVSVTKATATAEVTEKPIPQTGWCYHLWSDIFKFVSYSSAIETFTFFSCIVITIYIQYRVRSRLGASKCDRARCHNGLFQITSQHQESDNSDLKFIVPNGEQLSSSVDVDDTRSSVKGRSDKNKDIPEDIETRPGSYLQNLEYSMRRVRSGHSYLTKYLPSRNRNWPWRRKEKKITFGNSRAKTRAKVEGKLALPATVRSEIAEMELYSESSDSNQLQSDEEFSSPRRLCTGSSSLNLNDADDVIRTFDLEIEGYFKAETDPSATAFEEITSGLRRLRDTEGKCNGSQLRNIIFNSVNVSSGAISSSPAFQKFLSNLRGGRFCCPYVEDV